ncbi:MAG: acyl--CoA ligase [Rhodobacteraceae bacterium]|nr:acyl--CoA ligase [Paracoccaceae bacterium]
MNQTFNIGFNFQTMAESQPEAPAIIAEDITLSYAKLWKITAAFAERMHQHGIDQSSIIAVHTNDIIVSLASLLASSLLGAQYVAVSKILEQDGVITPTHYIRSPEVEGADDKNYIQIDHSWAPAFVDIDKNVSYPGYRSADAPWMILHTSGTTGTAKYMVLSQRLVFDRSHAVQNDFHGQKTRVSILFSCQTRPFYARALAALLFGSTLIDSINICFWQQEKVNTVCGSSYQINKLLADNTMTPKIDLVEVSGAKLTADIAAVLKSSFTKVIDFYGAGETNKSHANEITIGSSGEIVATGIKLDGRIEIVDEHDNPCAAGKRGLVRIKNDYLVPGYLNAPAAQQKSFRDGWFYPGDYGHWGKAGALVIEGRDDELVNIAGIKFDPSRIDTALLTCTGIKAAACFLIPSSDVENKLMAFVELVDFKAPDQYINKAYQHCVEKFGTVIAPINIIVVPEIPRTEDGAVKRQKCKDMAVEIFKHAARKN